VKVIEREKILKQAIALAVGGRCWQQWGIPGPALQVFVVPVRQDSSLSYVPVVNCELSVSGTVYEIYLVINQLVIYVYNYSVLNFCGWG
jgi:hypothetical protein